VLGEGGAADCHLDPSTSSLKRCTLAELLRYVTSTSRSICWLCQLLTDDYRCPARTGELLGICQKHGSNFHCTASIEGSYDRVNSFDRTYVPGEPIYNTLLERRPGEGYLIQHGASVAHLHNRTGRRGCGLPRGSPAPHAPGSGVRHGAWWPTESRTSTGCRFRRKPGAGDHATRRDAAAAHLGGGHYGFVQVYGEDAAGGSPVSGRVSR